MNWWNYAIALALHACYPPEPLGSPTPYSVPREQRVDYDSLDGHSVADPDGADFSGVDASDDAPLWAGGG